MSKKAFHPVALIIIAIAFWGLVHQLLNNPKALFTQILIFAVVGGILFFLYRRFISKRFNLNRPMKIKPSPSATRNNVVPHQRNSAQAKRKSSTRSLAKRRSAPNLTVIEGKKNKKRNRALF